MTYYEKARAAACPGGCGKGIGIYDFGEMGRLHFTGNHANHVFKCTAPTPLEFAEQKAEECERLAEDKRQAEARAAKKARECELLAAERDEARRDVERITKLNQFYIDAVVKRQPILCKCGHAHILTSGERIDRCNYSSGCMDFCDCDKYVPRPSSTIEQMAERAEKAEARLRQVDDVLVTDWITVEDGDYRNAMHRYLEYNIALHDNPQVSEDAARRKKNERRRTTDTRLAR